MPYLTDKSGAGLSETSVSHGFPTCGTPGPAINCPKPHFSFALEQGADCQEGSWIGHPG